MNIIEEVGYIVTGGFSGTAVSPELRSMVRECRMRGVILYSRNIESLEQVRELISSIRDLRNGEDLLISVDQEGGRVSRLPPPATQLPPQSILGEIGDRELAEVYGRVIARDCLSFGFDVDFAPVLDLRFSEEPVVGDRSIGKDPEVVASLGVRVLSGMLEEGVIPCAKHFPGHGRSPLDSHEELPVVDTPFQKLMDEDIIPFRKAIEKGVPLIMTAHIVYSDIDGELPATFSRKVLGILRKDMDFKGVIITDDLEMGAIQKNFAIEDVIDLWIDGEADILIFSKDPDKTIYAIERIVRMAERKSKIKERVIRSANRVRSLIGLNRAVRKGKLEERMEVLPCETKRHILEVQSLRERFEKHINER